MKLLKSLFKPSDLDYVMDTYMMFGIILFGFIQFVLPIVDSPSKLLVMKYACVLLAGIGFTYKLFRVVIKAWRESRTEV